MNIIRIHTETQEQYNVVTSHYINALHKNYWSTYKEEMVVNVENGVCMNYGNTPFYEKRGEKVYSFTEWQELVNPKKELSVKDITTFTVLCDTRADFEDALLYYGRDPERYSEHPGYRLYISNNIYYGWDREGAQNRLSNPAYTYSQWKAIYKPKTEAKKESNMKYVVEVKSQQESDAVYKQNGKSPVKRTGYPLHIASSGSWNEANSFHHKPENIKVYGPLLSFAQFAAMFDINLKPNKTLKLTDDYSAVVNYETKIVQVGCQSIPFTKVEELAKLIKE